MLVKSTLCLKTVSRCSLLVYAILGEASCLLLEDMELVFD